METGERGSFCEATFGPLILLFGCLVLYLSRDIQVNAMADGHDPGPKSLPVALSVGLILSGLMFTFQSRKTIWNRGRREGEAGAAGGVAYVLKGLAVLGSLVFYVVSWRYLGFTTATWVFSVLLMKVWGVNGWWPGIVSIVLVVFIHLLFVQMFKVPLPKGIWIPI